MVERNKLRYRQLGPITTSENEEDVVVSTSGNNSSIDLETDGIGSSINITSKEENSSINIKTEDHFSDIEISILKNEADIQLKTEGLESLIKLDTDGANSPIQIDTKGLNSSISSGTEGNNAGISLSTSGDASAIAAVTSGENSPVELSTGGVGSDIAIESASAEAPIVCRTQGVESHISLSAQGSDSHIRIISEYDSVDVEGVDVSVTSVRIQPEVADSGDPFGNKFAVGINRIARKLITIPGCDQYGVFFIEEPEEPEELVIPIDIPYGTKLIGLFFILRMNTDNDPPIDVNIKLNQVLLDPAPGGFCITIAEEELGLPENAVNTEHLIWSNKGDFDTNIILWDDSDPYPALPKLLGDGDWPDYVNNSNLHLEDIALEYGGTNYYHGTRNRLYANLLNETFPTIDGLWTDNPHFLSIETEGSINLRYLMAYYAAEAHCP